jgi:hypothetical protein
MDEPQTAKVSGESRNPEGVGLYCLFSNQQKDLGLFGDLRSRVGFSLVDQGFLS